MVKLRGRLPRSDFAHPPQSKRNGGHPHVILHPHLAPRPPQSRHTAFYRAACMIVYLNAKAWLREACRALAPWRTGTPGASSHPHIGASQSAGWQYRASSHTLAGRQRRARLLLGLRRRAVLGDRCSIHISNRYSIHIVLWRGRMER